jgi:hypothetical protein
MLCEVLNDLDNPLFVIREKTSFETLLQYRLYNNADITRFINLVYGLVFHKVEKHVVGFFNLQ